MYTFVYVTRVRWTHGVLYVFKALTLRTPRYVTLSNAERENERKRARVATEDKVEQYIDRGEAHAYTLHDDDDDDDVCLACLKKDTISLCKLRR